VCIHANASNSAQWRGLMDLLAPKFHVFAPDSYGSGKSPEWPSDRVIALRDEVALLEPLFARAGATAAARATLEGIGGMVIDLAKLFDDLVE